MESLLKALSASESIAIVALSMMVVFMGAMYIKLFNAYLNQGDKTVQTLNKMITTLEVIKDRMK